MNGGHPAVDDALLQRVLGEFLEMPGLRLTCRQAERLWGLDEWTCRQVLELLVEAKFLCRPAHGTYMRISEGRAAYPPSMAKARINDGRSRRNKEAV